MNTRNTLSFANFAAVCSSLLLAGALSAQGTINQAPGVDAGALAGAKLKGTTTRAQATVGGQSGASQDSDQLDTANKKQAHDDRQPLDARAADSDIPSKPPCQQKQPGQEDRADGSDSDGPSLDLIDQVTEDDGDELSVDRAGGSDSDGPSLDLIDEVTEDDGDELSVDRDAGIDPVPEPIPAAEPMNLSLSIRGVDGGLAFTLERDTDGPAEQMWIGGILGGLDPDTVRYSADLPPLLGRSTVLAAAVVMQGQLDQSVTAEVRHQGFDWVGFYVQGVAFNLEGAQATRVLPAEFGQGGER